MAHICYFQFNRPQSKDGVATMSKLWLVGLISGSRSQSCKGATNGSYLYGGAPFGTGMSGGIYPGGTGASYGSYPQSYSNQDYQYSTPFQTSAASTSAYYGHPTASASSYYYNPSPSSASSTTPAYSSPSNPPISGNKQAISYLGSFSFHSLL